MTLNEYQLKARATAIYADGKMPLERITYAALGLCGEAGEVAERVKKFLREDTGELSVIDELGDVLWYLSSLAYECGLTLDDVADYNLEKLADRHSRGVIKGDGDER